MFQTILSIYWSKGHLYNYIWSSLHTRVCFVQQISSTKQLKVCQEKYLLTMLAKLLLMIDVSSLFILFFYPTPNHLSNQIKPHLLSILLQPQSARNTYQLTNPPASLRYNKIFEHARRTIWWSHCKTLISDENMVSGFDDFLALSMGELSFFLKDG